MFGLPAAALAMIHVANKKQRKVAVGILSAAALTAFLTGITEPLEFSFMFVAFPLYVIHAVLTGLSLAIAYLLDIHLGFSFSAGLADLLLYGTAPAAKNIPLLIGMGVVFFVVYYVLFRFAMSRKPNSRRRKRRTSVTVPIPSLPLPRPDRPSRPRRSPRLPAPTPRPSK
jgi:PTS system N-acetylglucosamine-specific IIC component